MNSNRKVRLNGICILSFFTFVCLACDKLPSQDSERKDTMNTPIKFTSKARSMSKEEAVRSAAAGIGLRDYKMADVKAEISDLSHESLPFLSKQLFGLETWRIEFNSLPFDDVNRQSEISNPNISRLVVFLAPESGQVMKVVSVWPDSVPRIADYPACVEEQRQMGDADRYTGLPIEAPKITLMEAITKCVPWSDGVKQIYACYVIHTSANHTAKPVWIVQLRGIQQIPFSIPGGVEGNIPEDAGNHLRNIIDAQTGEWLGADTVPQPAGPLEYRY
jgi:hypothetical protein